MNTLNKIGWVAIAIGVLGLLSRLLGYLKIPFIFVVSHWYGPFLLGIICIVVSRRMNTRG